MKNLTKILPHAKFEQNWTINGQMEALWTAKVTTWVQGVTFAADMSNTVEGDIDIDFLGVLTLTIDIELVTFE